VTQIRITHRSSDNPKQEDTMLASATERSGIEDLDGSGPGPVQCTVHAGSLDGAPYRVEVPPNWDGTLMLYSHHYRQPGSPCPALVVPSSDELGPRLDGETLRRLLLARGVALGGTAKTTGWMMEDTLHDQVALLAWFREHVGQPRHTYAWGVSPGGLASIVLAQLHPGHFDGALSLGADASGVINQMQLRLDMGHVVNTLLADGSLELDRITDPQANLQRAIAVITAASQGDALARARLMLAGAVANMVPLADSHSAAVPTDLSEAARHLAWVIVLAHGSILFGPARMELEGRAGGNPLWNEGVDYKDLYARSTLRGLVEQAYLEAGADLEADLDKVNAGPRVAADRRATEYLIRTGGFPGLTPVPVVTLHSTLDGAAPVEHERSLADRVALVGDPANLRQLYLARGFTCAFSPAEILAALDVLQHRVHTGAWGDVAAESLNAVAGAHPDADRRVYNFWIPQDQERWASLPPSFVDYQPSPLPRSYPF
jgi:hypothetical protein